MAVRALHPVRLEDGFVSGGFQLVFLGAETGERLWAVMPAFLQQLEERQREDFPAGSVSAEWFAACEPGELSSPLRTGLHVRLRLPETVRAAEADGLCRQEAEKAVAWLKTQNISCDLPAWEGEGTVRLYPAGGDRQFRFFTKERRIGRNGEEPVFYFPQLAAAAPLGLRELESAIERNDARGISLHLLQFPAGFEKQEEKARGALRSLPEEGPWAEAEKGPRWGMALTLWSGSEEDISRFAGETAAVLQQSGIFLTERRPKGFDDGRAAQLVYDPWALLRWYMDQTGVKLSARALSATEEELEPLFRAEKKAANVHRIRPMVPENNGDIRKTAGTIGDEQLKRMADRLDESLSAEQFLATAGQMLARLDALTDREKDLDGKLQRLDALIRMQDTVSARRLKLLETKVTASISEGTRQVLGQLQTNLTGVMEKLAELPATPEGTAQAAETLMTAIPPQVEIRLTPEELKALGIEREEELMGIGLTEEESRLLRIALTLARIGLQQEEENQQYMPFAAPLGCLYEMLVRNSFDPKLTEKDMENRRKEYELRQAADYRPDRRMPPDNRERLELSFYDYISRYRVYDGYYQHVTLDGNRMKDPVEWNIWFACFKCVRAIRNKVNASVGSVSRTELENLYRLMLKPGAASKWSAIEYQLQHPARTSAGGPDMSLQIRHYDDKNHISPFVMRQYIARNGEQSFGESLIRFLLRVRKTTEWQDAG